MSSSTGERRGLPKIHRKFLTSSLHISLLLLFGTVAGVNEEDVDRDGMSSKLLRGIVVKVILS